MRIKDTLSCIATALALSVAPYAMAQFLTPGSNLVIEGVPPISTELVDKVIDTGFFWYDATNIDSDEIKPVLYE